MRTGTLCRWPARFAALLALLWLSGALVGEVSAGEPQASQCQSLTLYLAQGGDSDPLEFVPKLVTGRLEWDPTYFAGVD